MNATVLIASGAVDQLEDRGDRDGFRLVLGNVGPRHIHSGRHAATRMGARRLPLVARTAPRPARSRDCGHQLWAAVLAKFVVSWRERRAALVGRPASFSLPLNPRVSLSLNPSYRCLDLTR